MMIHFGNERWNQAAAFALRYEVFVLEQGIELTDEFDFLDTESRNFFVAYKGSLVIGVVRYQKKNPLTIQPDRLCIKKEYRGQGLGKKLLALLEEKARSENCTHSVLSAEITATPFYESVGYCVQSASYMEDGIPCIEMGKEL